MEAKNVTIGCVAVFDSGEIKAVHSTKVMPENRIEIDFGDNESKRVLALDEEVNWIVDVDELTVLYGSLIQNTSRSIVNQLVDKSSGTIDQEDRKHFVDRINKEMCSMYIHGIVAGSAIMMRKYNKEDKKDEG